MKPWDPPEEHFYPVLDGLLDEWRTNVRLPFEGVRVVGAMWSSACHDVKDFLDRNSIPYQWLDIERDDEARRLLGAAAVSDPSVPVLFSLTARCWCKPTLQQVAEKAGLRTHAENPFYDVIIIGGGPAGLSAAVYASADGLKVLLIERHALSPADSLSSPYPPSWNFAATARRADAVKLRPPCDSSPSGQSPEQPESRVSDDGRRHKTKTDVPVPEVRIVPVPDGAAHILC